MNTAIDTSVLLTLLKQEPGWEGWSESLRRAAGEGRLVVCPVVFAEVSGGLGGEVESLELLAALGIDYDPIEPAAAHLAGSAFREYRSLGGPREHLIPDFLIAAHAQLQAGRLAAIDRGYLRRYFPALTLAKPSPA